MEFGELLKSFLMDLLGLFRTQVVKDGMTLSQVLILSSLPDEGIDMTGLAQKLGVDNSTATRLVDGLQRKGWVRKNRNPQDRRMMIVYLTETGEDLQQRIEENIDQFGNRVFSSIPFEDRDELKEVLSSFHWTVSKLILKNQ